MTGFSAPHVGAGADADVRRHRCSHPYDLGRVAQSDLNAFSQDPERALEMIHTRLVGDIEKAIDLGRMPTAAAGEGHPCGRSCGPGSRIRGGRVHDARHPPHHHRRLRLQGQGNLLTPRPRRERGQPGSCRRSFQPQVLLDALDGALLQLFAATVHRQVANAFVAPYAEVAAALGLSRLRPSDTTSP